MRKAGGRDFHPLASFSQQPEGELAVNAGGHLQHTPGVSLKPVNARLQDALDGIGDGGFFPAGRQFPAVV